MVNEKTARIITYIGAAAACTLTLLYPLTYETNNFGDSITGTVGGVVTALLITLPFLFRKSVYTTVAFATIAYICGPPLHYFTVGFQGGFLIPTGLLGAYIFLGPLFLSYVVTMQIARYFIPSHLWWINILIGFTPVLIDSSLDHTGLHLLMLNIALPIAIVVTAIIYLRAWGKKK